MSWLIDPGPDTSREERIIDQLRRDRDDLLAALENAARIAAEARSFVGSDNDEMVKLRSAMFAIEASSTTLIRRIKGTPP